MTLEAGGSAGAQEEGADMQAESTSDVMPVTGPTEAATQSPEAEAPTQAGPQNEGKRTQLKRVRENIESLSKDVGSFRASHEASTKKLEKQVAALRSELGAQTLSKDVGSFRKSHEASTKKLEKQVAALRSDLATLKSDIAKDAAKSRARQEEALAKIAKKLGAKPSKPSKPAKGAKKKR